MDPSLAKMPTPGVVGRLKALSREGKPDEFSRLLLLFVDELPQRAKSMRSDLAAETLRSIAKLPDTACHGGPILRALVPRICADVDSLPPELLFGVCTSLATFESVDADAVAVARQSLAPLFRRVAKCVTGCKPYVLAMALRVVKHLGPLTEGGEIHDAAQQMCRSALPHLSRNVSELGPTMIVDIVRALGCLRPDGGIMARTSTLLRSALCQPQNYNKALAAELIAAAARLPLERPAKQLVEDFRSFHARQEPQPSS